MSVTILLPCEVSLVGFQWGGEDVPFTSVVQRGILPYQKATPNRSASETLLVRADGPVLITLPETNHDIRDLFKHPLRRAIHQVQRGFIIRLCETMCIGEPAAGLSVRGRKKGDRAYLWKPLPSIRTTRYVAGRSESGSSKLRTYSKREFAMSVVVHHGERVTRPCNK